MSDITISIKEYTMIINKGDTTFDFRMSYKIKSLKESIDNYNWYSSYITLYYVDLSRLKKYTVISERVKYVLITQIFADTSFLHYIFVNFIFDLHCFYLENVIISIHDIISLSFFECFTLSLLRQL